MLSSKRDDSLQIRSRLLFSQSSQATPSQALNSAFGQCNLADASQLTGSGPQSSGDVSMSQAQPPSSQMESWGLRSLASQAGALGSQDFVTPAEQQFDNEPTTGAKKMRSPAQLSPGKANKRHRSLMPQGSQNSQPPMFPPPQASRFGKDMRRSPKCAHNAFIHDEPQAISIGKRLPAVSMYKEVFKEVKRLGEGNFSKVYHVTNRMDGTDYAVKRSKMEVTDDSTQKQWYQEIAALAAAGSHTNIVRYYFAWMEIQGEGVHFYIQLERCGTSLAQRACLELEPFKEAELLELLRQMASALHHLHSRGIAHMDVKPDNIYSTEDGQFKLGDFGLATSLWGSKNLDVQEGDARYLPSEVLNGDHSRLDKADMFGLGAVLYRLATGSELPESGEQYQNIRCGKLKLVPRLSTSFANMMKRLMSKNPQDRPSPRDLLSDKIFAKQQQSLYKKLDLRPAD